jgi:hypothetical protein
MTDLRNCARIILALSPLLLSLGCSTPPDEPDDVETTESAVTQNSTLSLTLQSIIRGDTAQTLPPTHVGLAFAGFTRPPGTSSFGGSTFSGSVDFFNQCTGPTGGPQSCVTPPTGAWTKTPVTFNPTSTTPITYTGELYMLPIGSGLGASFKRCFHFGFVPSTGRMTPVPSTAAGCETSGPDDRNDPVTCDATTCTATVNISTTTRDATPWKVKFAYAMSPVSTVTSGLMTPDYFITNVYYAPPGRSSSVNYVSTTTIGTTTTATSTFETSVNVNASVSADVIISPSADVKVGKKWGTTRTDELDVTVDKSSGYMKTGVVDGIDHNYDEIWLLLRPKLSVNYTSFANGANPTINWSFAAGQDGRTNAVPIFVYAGWLNGQVPWDTNVQGQLTAVGITSDDYPQILGADPFATGTLSDPAQDPNRYDFIASHPFEPPLHAGDPPGLQTYGASQKTTMSTTNGSSHEFSVGVTLSGGVDFLDVINAKLSVEGEWKWTNSSSVKETTGTGTTDTLIVGQPQFGYQGPNFLSVYEDKIYKTYAFGLNGICGNGVTAQTCNAARPQCVWTRWGFEPGEPFGWSNSADNGSSLSTAQPHAGTQSLFVTAPDASGVASRIDTTPCFTGGDGTMDLRGKRFTASVFVPTSTSSYAGTSCRLRAFNHAFQESAISSQAVRSPITPGAWFQLTGVFPSTAVEQQIYELTVQCNLPTDWTLADPTKGWYADDISVQ